MTDTYPDSPFPTVEAAQAAFVALTTDSRKYLVVEVADVVTSFMDRRFGALDDLLAVAPEPEFKAVKEALDAVKTATEAFIYAVGTATDTPVVPAGTPR